MINKNKRNMLIINASVDVMIIILSNIFSKVDINERLQISIILFGFGIFCSLFFHYFFIWNINSMD